jgi:uncharacterized membrane protein
VALAAGWLLLGSAGAKRAAAEAAESGPEARLARARQARDTARRRWTGVVGLLVVGFLATAFVQSSRLPDRTPAQPLALQNGVASFDTSAVADGHLHFFETVVSDSAGAAHPVRFFAIRYGGAVRTCFDACEICGAKGYFEDHGAVVCRNCTSPIVLSSLGRSGGCNPIPLSHEIGGRVTVAGGELARALPRLRGR